MQSALAEVWAPFEPDVMNIAGRLDDGTAPVVEEDILLCIKSGARCMVLDCSDLTYITGAGLRAMISLAHTMKTVGGSLVLCALQPQVDDMFAITGFGGIIPIYGNRNESIAALAG